MSSPNSPEGSDRRPVNDVFDAANAQFERLRHGRDAAPGNASTAAEASAHSVDYICAFWPHVVSAITADPDKLGISIVRAVGGQTQRVHADALREGYANHPDHADDPAVAARLGGILSSLALMQQILNQAVGDWAQDFEGNPPRCPHAFEMPIEDYVSLRMLLPRREAGSEHERVGGNAPTLVMGGTATAITMCWNLLNEIPRAYHELTGAEPDRATVEAIWSDTRELIFRIGSSSLAAFVAFASACATSSEVMLWEGAAELGLARKGDHFEWTMSALLEERFNETFARVAADQQQHYLGCAALFARADALPLNPEFADAVDGEREQIVFAELVRWITAVARRQFFSAFERA